VHRFRESYFPALVAELKDEFAVIKSRVSPDLILTHRRRDEHQDHRTIAELTWNAFRDHLILEYEIPKYEGDLGRPNLFVPLDEATATKKVDLLMEHFGTQRAKGWFRPETFRAVMALRAIECNAADGWAEGFHARKLIV
jgi:LmbE family N-acetylglucosaminyl deacetylase